jgi:hypothetical protein
MQFGLVFLSVVGMFVQENQASYKLDEALQNGRNSGKSIFVYVMDKM